VVKPNGSLKEIDLNAIRGLVLIALLLAAAHFFEPGCPDDCNYRHLALYLCLPTAAADWLGAVF